MRKFIMLLLISSLLLGCTEAKVIEPTCQEFQESLTMEFRNLFIEYGSDFDHMLALERPIQPDEDVAKALASMKKEIDVIAYPLFNTEVEDCNAKKCSARMPGYKFGLYENTNNYLILFTNETGYLTSQPYRLKGYISYYKTTSDKIDIETKKQFQDIKIKGVGRVHINSLEPYTC